MDDPKRITDLHDIDDPKCIASVLQRYLKNTATKSLQWLGLVGFSTLRSHSERSQRFLSCRERKLLEVA